jgi:hypothetical protein
MKLRTDLQALFKTNISDPAWNRTPDYETDIPRISEHAVLQLVQVLYHKKIVSSFSDGVIGIFHCLKTSGRTISLGSTLLLTEMSNRNLFQG